MISLSFQNMIVNRLAAKWTDGAPDAGVKWLPTMVIWPAGTLNDALEMTGLTTAAIKLWASVRMLRHRMALVFDMVFMYVPFEVEGCAQPPLGEGCYKVKRKPAADFRESFRHTKSALA